MRNRSSSLVFGAAGKPDLISIKYLLHDRVSFMSPLLQNYSSEMHNVSQTPALNDVYVIFKNFYNVSIKYSFDFNERLTKPKRRLFWCCIEWLYLIHSSAISSSNNLT